MSVLTAAGEFAGRVSIVSSRDSALNAAVTAAGSTGS